MRRQWISCRQRNARFYDIIAQAVSETGVADSCRRSSHHGGTIAISRDMLKKYAKLAGLVGQCRQGRRQEVGRQVF